jgi:hypothetical protein
MAHTSSKLLHFCVNSCFFSCATSACAENGSSELQQPRQFKADECSCSLKSHCKELHDCPVPLRHAPSMLNIQNKHTMSDRSRSLAPSLCMESSVTVLVLLGRLDCGVESKLPLVGVSLCMEGKSSHLHGRSTRRKRSKPYTPLASQARTHTRFLPVCWGLMDDTSCSSASLSCSRSFCNCWSCKHTRQKSQASDR